MWSYVSELVEHLLATTLLGVVRIQDLEPALWLGGIRPEPMLTDYSFQILGADRAE